MVFIIQATPIILKPPPHQSTQNITLMSRLTRALTTIRVRELEDLFIPTLRNCRDPKALKKTHALVLKLSLSQSNFLATKMIDACHALGDASHARLIFDRVAEPNSFLYNAMIRVFARNAMDVEALALYKQMVTKMVDRSPVLPNEFTFPFVLKCCVGLGCASPGRQVHAHVWKFGPKSHHMVDNALMDLYLKCGCLEDGHKVFDEMHERDLVAWNGLLSGYAKAGRMGKARTVFEVMPERNVVSFTAMVSGFVRVGGYSEALGVFREMQELGLEPDGVSVVAVLPACAQLGAFEIGKWIHIYAGRKGLVRSVCVCNALIEMYSKCGCVDRALELFDRMSEKDVISWSTVIGGLANHGRAREAMELFGEMERAKVEPNGITFLGLLSACVHAGFWREGLKYFDSMKEDYDLEPEAEHYGCLVDLLGRSGRLDQALEAIKKMPMKPDSKIWGSLLNSCRIHSNLKIAIITMEHLSELEPDDIGNYVLLSNIYADVERWDGVAKIRKLIRSKHTRKTPGCSSIEIDSRVEEFVSGDDSKPYAKDLFSMLGLLVLDQNLGTEAMIEIMAEDSKGLS